jgi:hypothetical protein
MLPRLMEKIDVRGPDECWPWTASLAGGGRPQFHHKGKTRIAQRVLWEEAHGPIPDGLHVLHTCDYGLCMNLHHLYLGTQAQNIDDCFTRGRARRFRKFDDAVIAAARAAVRAGERRVDVARRFGMSKPMVTKIMKVHV